MNKLEDSALHQVVWDSVMVQLNKLGTDLKDFITDATQRTDGHLDNKIADISNATKALVESVMATVATSPSLGSTNVGHIHPPLDYRQALAKPPPHVDPRLAAKEGIKLHQFFLEGITKDSEIGKMTVAEARKVVNKAIDEAGGGEHKAQSAIWQSKEGLLVEMDLDVGAAWMKVNTNSQSFCNALGPGISIRQQFYSVFTYNASTVLDLDNKDHLKEIAEANNIQEESLVAMR